MDVDGTLTDGQIFMGQSGEIFKSFSVKDGYAIAHILKQHKIIPVIITGRHSDIVSRRAAELDIRHVFQGIEDKTQCLREILSQEWTYDLKLQNVAYIGDDLPDYECMQMIKDAGGIVGCPSDACAKIKDISDFVSCHKGGDGAVREFIEHITMVPM
jgi:3-deoxy-D-manno-octulosonate 8-phosphate phosphatase (KDO 8-P phosphatase)